jgi:hypothetical protein
MRSSNPRAAIPSSRRALERLLSVDEVAKFLGIPVSIYQWRPAIASLATVGEPGRMPRMAGVIRRWGGSRHCGQRRRPNRLRPRSTTQGLRESR